MTDRPILFSGPMIRALLAGTKTVTRRGADSPYAPGDRLWVREAFRLPKNIDGRSPGQTVKSCLDSGYSKAWAPIQFEADGVRRDWGDWRETPPGRLRAAMHMPRAYSRLTLAVISVRVERLQDITLAGIQAEGIWTDPKGLDALGALPAWIALWDSLHGSGAWDSNPMVKAIAFKVLLENIDA